MGPKVSEHLWWKQYLQIYTEERKDSETDREIERERKPQNYLRKAIGNEIKP